MRMTVPLSHVTKNAPAEAGVMPAIPALRPDARQSVSPIVSTAPSGVMTPMCPSVAAKATVPRASMIEPTCAGATRTDGTPDEWEVLDRLRFVG
jgi:hypothetical protein